MNKIFMRKMCRELKSNMVKYAILWLLMAVCMYVVVAIVVSAEKVILGTEAKCEENQVEDGQFKLFMSLTGAQEKEIQDQGVTIEKMFSIDVSVAEDKTLRIMKNRQDINQIELDEGHIATSADEIVLEKIFSSNNNIQVGDKIDVGEYSFQVCGIGTVPDYDVPLEEYSDTAAESKRFGLGFITDQCYEEIKQSISRKTEDICYAYRLNGKMDASELKQRLKGFHFEYDGVERNNLTQFMEAKDNSRIRAAARDQVMNKRMGLFAGVILMILFAYVLSVFIVHQIHQESSIIGTFYAMGIGKRMLLRQYIALPTAIAFLGSVTGGILGFSPIGANVMGKQTREYFSLPEFNTVYPVYLLFYVFVLPALISVVVNWMVINRKLSGTALALIRNEQTRKNNFSINLNHLGFVRKFQIRQMIREMRSGLTVVFGIFVTMLVVVLAINCYLLCDNIGKDTASGTKYEYMYQLKYPEKEKPKGERDYCESFYSKSLTHTAHGFTLNIPIIGLDEKEKYYNVTPPEGKSNLVVSKAMSEKYDLQVGDKIILTDAAEEMDYVFTVQEISDYSSGLLGFMKAKDMRELFGEEEEFYNMILSDRELDIQQERLYGVSDKEDILRSATVFSEMMQSMVITLIFVSIIVFCSVMYLMTNVMLERASFGMSLVKIFGYRTREIKQLYLNGNFFIVLIGTVVSIPLAKNLVDQFFPSVVANVNSGLHYQFSWQIYAGILVCVLLVYMGINGIQTRKIAKVTPQEVLKNRE